MSDGAPQLAADLAAAADELARGVDHAGELAAQQLATAAQRGAPRRTGYLAGSIHADGATVAVGAPYGRVIHDGWSAHHIRAQPFLADAADRVDWPGPYVDAAMTALDQLHTTY